MPASDYLRVTAHGTRPLFGRVLVTVDKEYQDEVRVGDTTLFVDTTYRPLHQVQDTATVVAVPREMAPWHTTECEVAVGDEVRLLYHAISNHHLVVLDGKRHWLVPYDHLYYVRRPDTTIQMVGGHVLVEPVLTQGGEEKTKAGLITNLDAGGKQRAVAGQGRLRYAPAGFPLPLGALVAYHKDADNPLEVNGETLYIMQGDRDLLVGL